MPGFTLQNKTRLSAVVTSQLRNREALLGGYEIWEISVKKN